MKYVFCTYMYTGLEVGERDSFSFPCYRYLGISRRRFALPDIALFYEKMKGILTSAFSRFRVFTISLTLPALLLPFLFLNKIIEGLNDK